MSDGPRVALTFDAEHPDRPPGPPGAVDRILDVLLAAGVRATFFVQGRWAQAHPETTRRIAEIGHLVGNHSHHHAPMTLLSDGGIRADVLDAHGALADGAGVEPRPWFRCPFGEGHDDPRVLEVLAGLGYRNVHWHVELEDWEPWRGGEEIARDALDGVARHGDPTVVLLHTWPVGTADGLPAIVGGLTERRARFVGVDELPGEALP